MKEFMRDVAVYTVKAVTIVEIMGRDAGWLTTAAALPVISGGKSPDLIYLPETDFDTEKFIQDVNKALSKHPDVLIAVSEGIRFKDGEYVGAGLQSGAVDVFGHKYLSGTAKVLEGLVKEKVGCKVRSIELSLTQRCAAHILSKTDIDESVLIGKGAVNAAAMGKSGVMMIYERSEGEVYSVSISSYDISKIANGIKKVPLEFINNEHNGVTDECIKYLAPLILGEVYPEYDNGIPKHLII
jgi:6-phosphofructokinase 1